jgi:hypothetical protein
MTYVATIILQVIWYVGRGRRTRIFRLSFRDRSARAEDPKLKNSHPEIKLTRALEEDLLQFAKRFARSARMHLTEKKRLTVCKQLLDDNTFLRDEDCIFGLQSSARIVLYTYVRVSLYLENRPIQQCVADYGARRAYESLKRTRTASLSIKGRCHKKIRA